MANNYVSYSVEFKLPEQAAKDLEKILSFVEKAESDEGEKAENELPTWFLVNKQDRDWEGVWGLSPDYFEISSKDIEGNVKVWVAAEDSTCWHVCQALAKVMEQYDIPGEIYFSECYYCSKLRLYEFGGVAYNVSKDGVLAMDTQQMAKHLPKLYALLDIIKDAQSGRKSNIGKPKLYELLDLIKGAKQ